MAKKKKAGAAAPAGETPKPDKAAAQSPSAAAKSGSAGPSTIIGMAALGALLGLLSGLNQWRQPPPTLSGDIAAASWMAYLLGAQGFDMQAAMEGALLGLVVGGGFAVSFLFGERKMLACWVLAGVGLALGALTLKTTVAAGAGWLLGWLLAMGVPDRKTA